MQGVGKLPRSRQRSHWKNEKRQQVTSSDKIGHILFTVRDAVIFQVVAMQFFFVSPKRLHEISSRNDHVFVLQHRKTRALFRRTVLAAMESYFFESFLVA